MTRIRALAALLALTAVAAATVASTAAGGTTPRRDIVGTAAAAGQFTTLTKLLTAAGLVTTLRQAGPYTVFAPTDAAFAKVPPQTLKALLADRKKLKAVLLYHVVPGRVTAAKVVRLKSAKTAEGQSLRIRTSGSKVVVGGARVVAADVKARNGVIHVVDRVLIPPKL